MNKLILLLMLIVLTISSYSQDLFIGANKYSIYTNESSSIGVIIGGTYKHIYFDLSSNLVTGIGKRINFFFVSDISVKTDKINTTLINVGYDFIKNKNYHITPIIGFGYTKDIWQNPIQDKKLDTYYFTDKMNPHLNIGISAKYYYKKLGVMAGIGLMERYKFCLVYNFNKTKYDR